MNSNDSNQLKIGSIIVGKDTADLSYSDDIGMILDHMKPGYLKIYWFQWYDICRQRKTSCVGTACSAIINFYYKVLK